MLKRYLFSGFLSLAITVTHAQGSGPGTRGARAAALGNASVTLSDVWAVGNNAAGLGQLSRPVVGVYAENRYLLSALNTVAVAAAMPVGAVENDKAQNGVVGVELQRFGGKLYNEQRVGAGYGYRGGLVSIGARVDMLQLSMEGLGSRRAVAVSLGGQAELVPKRLVFGAYLYNLNQAKLAEYQDERVPTVLKAGLSYRPTAKVSFHIETEKDVEQDADFKAGLEYRIIEKLALRAGFRTLTEETTGGLGFQAGALQIDYAAAWHAALGLSQHVGISFQFEKQP
ncbi:hypothetical protein J0X19_05665 [Hymenobacter sp. BT186]|uniref:PorV/PorQ family protein n=1 Tax=Hymenobacter telluris TaxID=2816474 RepID=A0A939EUL2_9BACT|nr:hypothetical protein [Hymenobacter telluris]MBO0357424.1 hypothetical protein [Hymenobacter telluris]MBW3373450.1 hypothetical protein [Hymenobacter norwichensis]